MKFFFQAGLLLIITFGFFSNAAADQQLRVVHQPSAVVNNNHEDFIKLLDNAIRSRENEMGYMKQKIALHALNKLKKDEEALQKMENEFRRLHLEVPDGDRELQDFLSGVVNFFWNWFLKWIVSPFLGPVWGTVCDTVNATYAMYSQYVSDCDCYYDVHRDRLHTGCNTVTNLCDNTTVSGLSACVVPRVELNAWVGGNLVTLLQAAGSGGGLAALEGIPFIGLLNLQTGFDSATFPQFTALPNPLLKKVVFTGGINSTHPENIIKACFIDIADVGRCDCTPCDNIAVDIDCSGLAATLSASADATEKAKGDALALIDTELNKYSNGNGCFGVDPTTFAMRMIDAGGF